MSPELQAAIEAAEKVNESPVYDRRGFFAIGPIPVWPTDELAKLMDEAKLALAEEHYARGSPDEERRALKLSHGRRLFSTREAERQRAALAT